MYNDYCAIYIFFFFSSRRRHTRCSRDWSSDVCSSDLENPGPDSLLALLGGPAAGALPGPRIPSRIDQETEQDGGSENRALCTHGALIIICPIRPARTRAIRGQGQTPSGGFRTQSRKPRIRYRSRLGA